ncbi:MAG: flavin reductase family protein [Caldiserica bacterium]|jgi:flavin reductase (DIM6/NTAB) family NADH-FMN oxidoreductase RutF|nr:flavin reductase family protein [Caldisericota bacterium]MDH7562544.1 flavin reductase family protein [Caldisericota bacterium]
MGRKTIEKNWPFLIHPTITVLLTAGFQGRDTITPIGWIMPLSGEPPLLALALKETRFGYELLRKSGEFGINVPSFNQAEKVWRCGKTSGREEDKFALTGFSREKGEAIKAPMIKEAIAWLECQLFEDKPFGDHRLIVGKVLRARVKEEVFDQNYQENFLPCLHLRKNLFLTTDWATKIAAGEGD